MTEYAHAKNIKPRPEVADAVDQEASQTFAIESQPIIFRPTGEDEERIARQPANGACTEGEFRAAQAEGNEERGETSLLN